MTGMVDDVQKPPPAASWNHPPLRQLVRDHQLSCSCRRGAHLSEETHLQPCHSSWCCKQQGQPWDWGRSHRPNTWEASVTVLVQEGPAPSRCGLDHSVCPGLAVQPNPEGKNWEVITVPAVGWAQGRPTSSFMQEELDLALQTHLKSKTATDSITWNHMHADIATKRLQSLAAPDFWSHDDEWRKEPLCVFLG